MNLKYSHLTDEVLLDETFRAAKNEQHATLELLDYLLEVERRKVFAIRGYSSMHQYVIQALGYSGSQATERINAMRLMRDQPTVRNQVETGTLTLTSAAQIQRFIQVEKKLGSPVSPEKAADLIQQCEGESSREVERILFAVASFPAQNAMKERTRVLPQNRTEIKFSIAQGTEEKMERIKNMVGQITLEKLFDLALDALEKEECKKRGLLSKERTNKKRDLLKKEIKPGKQKKAASDIATLAPAQQKKSDDLPKEKIEQQTKSSIQKNKRENARYVPIEFKRAIYTRSRGQCEFIDAKTQSRCSSRHRLQFDHIIPHALGGKTIIDNLRHLCPEHNARAAIEAGLRFRGTKQIPALIVQSG